MTRRSIRVGAEGGGSGRTSASPVAPGGERRPARWAALFVLPYLLLGVVWAFSNPPGAAPDEADHLIKALGAARLDVGRTYEGPPLFAGPVGRRNASISRELSIPARLVPDGFSCTAFDPAQTAACQPDGRPSGDGSTSRLTTVGAYPIFGYIPLGVAARMTSSPSQAFVAGRLASLVLSMALLSLGAWHLARWLGRWSLAGVVLCLTPMATFSSAIVSTSGLEIMSAVALSCVAVVASRHADSLRDAGTMAVVAVAGSTLVLSRQLGVATLFLLTGLVIARGGGRIVWEEVLRGRRATLAAGTALATSCVGLVLWERAFDHPSETGSLWSGGAVRAFFDQLYHYVASGVGEFGYLDTPLPGIAIGAWIALVSLVCGLAVIGGRRADRWSIAAALAFIVLVSYGTHATVFYSIGAGLQGRHLLPIFTVVPILAGVVVVELVQDVGRPDIARRLVVSIAAVMAGLELLSVLVNARRYAVGSDGPLVFLGDAEWSPRLGWLPWIAVATGASAVLFAITIQSQPRQAGDDPSGAVHVEW